MEVDGEISEGESEIQADDARNLESSGPSAGPKEEANEELLEEVDAPQSALAKAEDNYKALDEALQKLLAGMSGKQEVAIRLKSISV